MYGNQGRRLLRLLAMLGLVAVIAAACSSDATTESDAAPDEQSSVTTTTAEVEEVTTTTAEVEEVTTTTAEVEPEPAAEAEAAEDTEIDPDWEQGRNGPAPAGTIRLPEFGGIQFNLDAERLIFQDQAYTILVVEDDSSSMEIDLIAPRATSRDVPITNVDELAAALLEDVMVELLEGDSVETPIGVARSFDFMTDRQRLADSNAHIQVGERGWAPFVFGKVWLIDTERGVFMVTAEAEEPDASVFEETVAAAETILATIEFVTIEEEASNGTPIVIETDVVFGSGGGTGTFVVTEGADDLGCSGGSMVEVGEQFGVTAEMTCEDGPADGTMSITFQPSDAPGDGDFNGPFWIDSGAGDLAGLTGIGDWAGFEGEDDESGLATYTGEFTLGNPAPDTAVAEFVAAFGVDDADKAWSFVSDRCERGASETPDGYSAFVAGYALDVPGATAENISADVDGGKAAISYDVHNDSGEFFESYTDQPWVFSEGNWYHDDC